LPHSRFVLFQSFARLVDLQRLKNVKVDPISVKISGTHHTISLLVNYTGNAKLRSFCYSMLHPNNACRKHLILSLSQRKKKYSIRRQCLPAKDLPQL